MSNLTVNMENLSDDEREQLLALVEKSQKACNPMEFKLGQQIFFVDVNGNDIKNSFRGDYLDNGMRDFGNLYHTKEQAETASKAMRRFNRILQFAILHGGYREFVRGGNNYSIYYSHDRNIWRVIALVVASYNTVYMTKECAELLCNKLNSGEYTL